MRKKKNYNESCNSNQEEFIANYCSIVKSERKLKIEYSYWTYDRWGIALFCSIIIPLGLFFLILIYLEVGIRMFFELFGCLFVHFLMLLTIELPIFCFLSAFRHKEELILDKDSETLIKNKVSKRFKQLKIVKFQKIDKLIYKAAEYDFFVQIILQNSKKISFFSGSEENCKKVCKNIAEFLEKPIYFRRLGYDKKIS